jgi:O-methyltransferase involved in polyketide biosynthesis
VRFRRLDDPESWRSRAKEARAIGEVFRDPEAQRIMADIAEGYERLADRPRSGEPNGKD